MSNTGSALEWAGVITGSGFAGSVLTKLLGRKRENAEAVKAITEAAVILIEPLERRISVLEESDRVTKSKLKRAESRLTLALDHIRALYVWISHHSPERTPPQPPDELGI